MLMKILISNFDGFFTIGSQGGLFVTDEILDVVEDSVKFGCYACTRNHQVASLESLNFFRKILLKDESKASLDN